MKKRIEHLLILAAGRGLRMMPLTNDIPKPMAQIWGSTLIANGIQRIESNVKYIHVTVGYKGALLSEHVVKLGVSTIINTNGFGNSWWIYNSLLRCLNEPIFVLTCDNLIEIDFDKLAMNYFDHNEPACMVIPVVPVEGLDGDYIFKNNNIVTKLDRNQTSDYYCSGVQILNPFKINAITQKTDDFNQVWSQLILQKQLYTSDIIPSRWYAVDSIENLTKINTEEPWK